MTDLVLLKSKEKGNYALYKDGKLVSNYSRHDYRDYIEDQVSRWGDEFAEREHEGPFPESLEEPKRRGRPPKAKEEAE